jgi:hypothetical protein
MPQVKGLKELKVAGPATTQAGTAESSSDISPGEFLLYLLFYFLIKSP